MYTLIIKLIKKLVKLLKFWKKKEIRCPVCDKVEIKKNFRKQPPRTKKIKIVIEEGSK